MIENEWKCFSNAIDAAGRDVKDWKKCTRECKGVKKKKKRSDSMSRVKGCEDVKTLA